MICRLTELPSGCETNCAVVTSSPSEGAASSHRSWKTRKASRPATASGVFASAISCSRLSTSVRVTSGMTSRMPRRRGSRRMSAAMSSAMAPFEHMSQRQAEDLRPCRPHTMKRPSSLCSTWLGCGHVLRPRFLHRHCGLFRTVRGAHAVHSATPPGSAKELSSHALVQRPHDSNSSTWCRRRSARPGHIYRDRSWLADRPLWPT